jgi:hypothetical protein
LRELCAAVRGEDRRQDDQKGDERAEGLTGEDQGALRAVDREIPLQRSQCDGDERALRPSGPPVR